MVMCASGVPCSAAFQPEILPTCCRSPCVGSVTAAWETSLEERAGVRRPLGYPG